MVNDIIERKNERPNLQVVSLICHIDKKMITYHGDKINNKLMNIDSQTKLQDYYDRLVSDINRYSLSCGDKCQGNFIVHGYYFRRVKLPFGLFRLRIMRLRCKDCGATHAILLSSLVPYSSIPLSVQVEVVKNRNNREGLKKVLDENPELAECDIYNLIIRYLCFWHQRLISIKVKSYNTNALIDNSFSNYLTQFMQCRKAINTLYTINHTR